MVRNRMLAPALTSHSRSSMAGTACCACPDAAPRSASICRRARYILWMSRMPDCPGLAYGPPKKTCWTPRWRAPASRPRPMIARRPGVLPSRPHGTTRRPAPEGYRRGPREQRTRPCTGLPVRRIPPSGCAPPYSRATIRRSPPHPKIPPYVKRLGSQEPERDRRRPATYVRSTCRDPSCGSPRRPLSPSRPHQIRCATGRCGGICGSCPEPSGSWGGGSSGRPTACSSPWA